jgi:hypothetical protein
VFPDSQIVANRVDAYPLQVSVAVSGGNMGSRSTTVWSGRQQDLFRKYGAQRDKSIKAMTANLQDLKEEFGDS